MLQDIGCILTYKIRDYLYDIYENIMKTDGPKENLGFYGLPAPAVQICRHKHFLFLFFRTFYGCLMYPLAKLTKGEWKIWYRK